MYINLERRDRKCWTAPSRRYYCESNWDRFGRWILAAAFVTIFVAVIITMVVRGKARRRIHANRFHPTTTGWAGQQAGASTYQADAHGANADSYNRANATQDQSSPAPPPPYPGPQGGVAYQQAPPPEAHVPKW